jgi:surface protein
MACNCYSISASQDPISPSLGVTFFYTTCDLESTSTTLEPFQSAYICSNGFPSAFPSDRGTIFQVDESFCGGCVTCSPTTPATGTEISMGCVYGAFGLAPFPGANIGLNSTLGVNRQPPQALGVTAIESLAETVLSADMGGLDTLNNYCCEPDPVSFVSTWNTANTTVGSSTSTQVKLPLKSNGVYNFTVSWGDGNTDTITTWNQAETTHTYANIGTYIITIDGTCQGFAFESTGDRSKILSITSFGNVIFGNYNGIFKGCLNLDLPSVTDIPNLSTMNSLLDMFRDCNSLTTVNNINSWDLSTITSTSGMFESSELFNSNIGNWNVSNVTDMSDMFVAAQAFNQPIGNWDVGNVTTMFYMFDAAISFNQDISGWDVSSVTNMTRMFRGATAFNQPIGGWNVANVTTMGLMFSNATSFNQPIGSWNVGNVTGMGGMFENTPFNQNIGGWNVSNVTVFSDFMAGKTPTDYSATNLDAIYNGWSSRPVSPFENISFGTIKYTAAGQAGRNILTGAPNNWTITDGGT